MYHPPLSLVNEMGRNRHVRTDYLLWISTACDTVGRWQSRHFRPCTGDVPKSQVMECSPDASNRIKGQRHPGADRTKPWPERAGLDSRRRCDVGQGVHCISDSDVVSTERGKRWMLVLLLLAAHARSSPSNGDRFAVGEGCAGKGSVWFGLGWFG